MSSVLYLGKDARCISAGNGDATFPRAILPVYVVGGEKPRRHIFQFDDFRNECPRRRCFFRCDTSRKRRVAATRFFVFFFSRDERYEKDRRPIDVPTTFVHAPRNLPPKSTRKPGKRDVATVTDDR